VAQQHNGAASAAAKAIGGENSGSESGKSISRINGIGA
jgi:hypothetical protein